MMRIVSAAALLFAGLLCTSPALADCTTAGGRVYAPGGIFYNTDHAVLQYCAGTVWRRLGGAAGTDGPLSNLTDVDDTLAPTNGQCLVYDTGAGEWQSGACGSGGGVLSGLTDVEVAGAADGNCLVYNSTSGKWEDGACSSGGDNLGSGGTTTGPIYSLNTTGYGYFGSSPNNYMRFDDAPVASANRIYVRLANAWEYVFHGDYFAPMFSNVNDLGITTDRWKDGWFSGTVTAGTFAGSGASLSALNASNLSTGTVGTARLGSGTANGTTFLRGDGLWAAPGGAADNLGNHTATTNIQLGANWLSGDGANEGLRIDAAGNVGIGALVSAPTQALDVAGNINIKNADPYLVWYENDQGVDQKRWDMFSGGSTLRLRAVNDAYTSANSAMEIGRTGFNITSVNFPNGNVGIGNLSPAAKLDITAQARTGTHSSTSSVYFSATAADGLAGPAANDFQFRHSNGTQGIGFGYAGIYATGSNADQTLSLQSRGTSHLLLNGFTAYATGNVGIGLSNPGRKLDVLGDARATNVYANGTAGTGTAQFLSQAGGVHRWTWGRNSTAEGGSDAGSDFFIGRFNDAGTYIDGVLTILRSNGNVGIGTVTPDSKFDVEWPTGQQFTAHGYALTLKAPAASSTVPWIEWNRGATRYAYMGYGDTAGAWGNRLDLALENGAEFAINGGNVGIGKNDPTTLLDVNGTIAGNYLRLNAQDGTNEGGELQLLGAGVNPAIQIDNFNGHARIHTLAAGKRLQILGGDGIEANSAYTSNWFRSTGNSGWYSETHGGGWHMSDTTWIRSYGGKNVYSDAIIRADGGFEVDGATVVNGTGRVQTGSLGSGTANSTTFLRGDGTWAAASGGAPTCVRRSAAVAGGATSGVSCTGGETLTGGGCDSMSYGGSWPSSATTWTCKAGGFGGTVYAVCCTF